MTTQAKINYLYDLVEYWDSSDVDLYRQIKQAKKKIKKMSNLKLTDSIFNPKNEK